MKTAIFTICSRNYLAYALTLQKSLQAAEPETPFFIYLADDAPEPGKEPEATIVPVRDLGLPDLLDMAFRYTVMEFNTAIKADCILDLLTNRGFDAAIYLDPDIRVSAPLEDVHAALAEGASAVLTPHILAPLAEGTVPSEAEIMQSGVFNLGFGAFARTPETLTFLHWWAEKLHTQCYAALERGLFVDQKFVDMAPAFIERLSIIRNPGYNVAYWNISERMVAETGTGVCVNGTPLVFFHFSGVVAGEPGTFSKHLGKARQAPSPAVKALVGQYLDMLDAMGHAHWAKVPYAFGQFRDGTPILPPMRRSPPASGTAENWFEAPDLAYWTSPDPSIDQEAGLVITRLMAGCHALRPDLQAAFPLTRRAGRQGFCDWFHAHGVREYRVPASYLPNVSPFAGGALLRRAVSSLRRRLR